MDFSKRISSMKVRSLFIAVLCIWALSFGYTHFFVPKYKFMSLSQENIENQWKNIETLLVASRHHVVPLLLFDIDLLPEIFVARDKVWKGTLHQCKTLCKHHPEEKNVITFAALASKFIPVKNEYIESLEDLGFTVHLSEVADPRKRGSAKREMIPSYLWMARRNHVIHIAFLHERGEEVKYMWVGPVTDRSWMRTVKAIAPAIGDGWHSLSAIGAKFPRYAQAYDLSHRFTGLPVYLDGHRISVPYHIRAFLDEYKHSRFIECDYARAEKHIAQRQTKIHKYDKHFQEAAKTMLVDAKNALDDVKIPFWLTGGTLLGWYRECGIIPHDTSVGIGIWARDYKDDIIKAMEDNGYFFKSRFGRPGDGMELAFLDKSNNQINMHFFRMNDDVVENLRTRPEDGMRFLFSYAPFLPCWSEFVGLKVRVPCETLGYIQTYFGDDWDKPQKDWLWYVNAQNKVPIGEWDQRDRRSVMEIHHRKIKDQPKVQKRGRN